MSLDAGITLKSNDLLDRFGFEDGFLCFPFLHKWYEEVGYYNILEGNDSYSHFFYSSQPLLLLAIDWFIVPRLPSVLGNALDLSNQQNNPVGIDHDKFYSKAESWDVGSNGEIVGLGFEVLVNNQQLAKLALIAYPPRNRGYLMFFKAVMLDLPGIDFFRDLYSERIILNHPSFLLRRLLDKYLDLYTDEDFEIASHLYHKVEEVDQFEKFFYLAKVL